MSAFEHKRCRRRSARLRSSDTFRRRLRLSCCHGDSGKPCNVSPPRPALAQLSDQRTDNPSRLSAPRMSRGNDGRAGGRLPTLKKGPNVVAGPKRDANASATCRFQQREKRKPSREGRVRGARFLSALWLGKTVSCIAISEATDGSICSKWLSGHLLPSLLVPIPPFFPTGAHIAPRREVRESMGLPTTYVDICRESGLTRPVRARASADVR